MTAAEGDGTRKEKAITSLRRRALVLAPPYFLLASVFAVSRAGEWHYFWERGGYGSGLRLFTVLLLIVPAALSAFFFAWLIVCLANYEFVP